jgi:hypothetical protein
LKHLPIYSSTQCSSESTDTQWSPAACVSIVLVSPTTWCFFSLTHHEKQDLLDCCQNWAEAVGMKFAQEKCVVLGANTHLTIYDEVLPEAESAAYLGIPFNREGLDLIKSAKHRPIKGRAVTMTLRQLGMNLTGFAPETSRRIYKTFIRPVLEYGTPLAPLAQAGIQALQTAQTHAMRMMLSAALLNAGYRVKSFETTPASTVGR